MPTKTLTSSFAAAATAILLVLALFAGCGCTPSNEDVIRRTVTQELDRYKNLDESVLERLSANAEEERLGELGISGNDFASAVVDGFEFKIESIEVTDSKAFVGVTVTSKSATDFESRLDAAITEFLDDPGTDSMTTEEKNAKVGEIAMEALKETKAISEDVAFNFQLEGTTWTCTNASQALDKLDSLVFSS